MMEWYYIISFFIFGLVMGSFVNVVGYRLPKGMSLIKPASHCPECNKRLKVKELIPIISYLIQLGKCSYCKKRISYLYPLIELTSGLLFVVSYISFNLSYELIIALFFSIFILIITVSDIRYLIINDEVLIIAFIFVFLVRIITKTNIITLLIDAFLPMIIMILIKLFGDTLFKKESLGVGDIKLMPILGLVLGFELALLIIFFGAFIALPIAFLALHIKKTNIIPFGPFLGLAALIVYFLKIDISWVTDLLLR